jgi:hypothetical protein
MGTLRVSGPERASWLNGVLTCDVKSVRPGVGSWGLLLSRTGKIQCAAWVLAGNEQLWIGISPGQQEHAFEALDQMLVMEDAELQDVSSEFDWFSVHGSESTARAAELATSFDGVSGSIGWTKLSGAALVVSKSSAPEVLTRLPLMNDAEWTQFRLQHDLPEYGVDYSNEDRPHEASLERRAVSWTKGCYLGQEAVCMQDMRGKVKRRLRSLRVSAAASAPMQAGALIMANEEPIGRVTSVAHDGQEWLCMAKCQLASLSQSLHVAGVEGQVSFVE